MRQELFAELEESIRQMKKIRKGELKGKVTTAITLGAGTIDAIAIRQQLGVSQAKFALLLGISLRTLQGWEQGRRQPKGAERTLLRLVDRNPDALLEAHRGAPTREPAARSS
mgnify:CR=1 FL=1